MIFLLALGGICLTMAAIPKEPYILVLLIYLAGKFLAVCAASTCWLFTSEVYPTNLRSQSLGTCSMVSRAFSLGSSFVADLAFIWGPLPLVLLGVPSIIAGFLALKLPESRGRPLPETFEEAVNMGKLDEYGMQSTTVVRDTLDTVQLLASSDEEDDADEIIVQS